MAYDLDITCSCGEVRGTVSNVNPRSVNRLICHCDDCQAFARYSGRPQEELDANGGTEICQTSAGAVSFQTGEDKLAALKLSPKGILRWHTTCCRSTMCNTLAGRAMPFVGIMRNRLSPKADGVAFEDIVGPLRGRVHLKFATGVVQSIEPEEVSLFRQVPRMAKIMLKGWLRGDHKRSPFFDAEGNPLKTPILIALDQKACLYRT